MPGIYRPKVVFMPSRRERFCRRQRSARRDSIYRATRLRHAPTIDRFAPIAGEMRDSTLIEESGIP